MKMFLSYWFWPNPGGWHYQDFRVQMLLAGCLILIILSFVLRFWRGRITSSVTRSLSASWSLSAFWFGIVALTLVVSRAESIQFLAMRFLWALWVLVLVLYALLQLVQFRRRHYTVIRRTQIVDEREKYLPRKKAKRQ